MNTKVKFSGQLRCLECGVVLTPGSVSWEHELCPKHLEEAEKPHTKPCSSCGKTVPLGDDYCRFCTSKTNFEAVEPLEHLENMGVPPRTRKIVAANIDIDEARYINESLFLHGHSGAGKTYRAAQILFQTARAFACDQIHFKPEAVCVFATTPELLNEIRAGFAAKNKSDQILEKYKEADLLVLDDFGVEKITDWTLTTLYMILAHRYEYEKMTIITSNLNLEELAVRMGDERLTSRIRSWCKLVPMTGGDRR